MGAVELNNSFEVDAPIDEAWKILNDVPAIAPCLPGAQLQEIDGEEYKGIVKVKVGPIKAKYKGVATFVETDEAAGRIVLGAAGRDSNGQGEAKAVITAQLVEAAGNRTLVEVSTDLAITGKVASFARGVMADVSAKLMDQFAKNLAEMLEESGSDAPETSSNGSTDPALDALKADPFAMKEAPEPAEQSEAPAAAKKPPQVARSAGTSPGSYGAPDIPEPEAIDLLETAGSPLIKRIIPPVVGLILLALVIRMLRRRRA